MNQQNEDNMEDNPGDILTINPTNPNHMQAINIEERNEINLTVMPGSKLSTPSVDELVPSSTVEDLTVEDLFEMTEPIVVNENDEHIHNQGNNETDQIASLNTPNPLSNSPTHTDESLYDLISQIQMPSRRTQCN